MRAFTIFIVCNVLFQNALNALELLSKKSLKVVKTESIGYGRNLKISAQIDLPDGQKLNPGAPSHITVYEKVSDGWEKIKKIDVNSKVTFPGLDFQFTESLTLKESDSEIAVDATLYHCSITKGPCYIDEFQTHLNRSEIKQKELSAKFFPTKNL